jgi:CheY-like chemotaxis protein
MSAVHNIILYAEDDEDDRILMREAVDALQTDYVLMMVENGHEAIKKLNELTTKHISPCIIILDGNMPFLTGKQTIEVIRNNKLWDEIPLCIFSTSSEMWFNDLIVKYGIPVYRKPLNLSEYNQIIQQLLKHCSGK